MPGAYSPGHGRFKVGANVRYVGEPRVFYEGQSEVLPGDTGTVVHDFGFDYRYLIKLDRPVGRRMTHGNGIEFDIRPGNSWSDWESVE